jgi:hypothetical protein
MKETFEHDINHQAFEGCPEYDIPHNPRMVGSDAYAAPSSAHLAGHLRTGMGRAEMVTAYRGRAHDKKDRRSIKNELK